MVVLVLVDVVGVDLVDVVVVVAVVFVVFVVVSVFLHLLIPFVNLANVLVPDVGVVDDHVGIFLMPLMTLLMGLQCLYYCSWLFWFR